VGAHGYGGARRRQVLEAIHRSPAPLSASEIAGRAGIHPSTARFHLDALLTDGVIERMLAEPCGPGRPRVVYRARPGMALGGERRYRVLAEILLSYLTSAASGGAATSAASGGAATAAADAGRAWGEHVIPRAAPFHEVGCAEAVTRVLRMLDDLAFAPETVAGEGDVPAQVRLRHCPFLELAEDHSDIVCSLHLGLIQGAFAGLRSPVTAAELIPFGEPDACVVHLTPAG
jgi:predicted ArsR family transcriptional regulator